MELLTLIAHNLVSFIVIISVIVFIHEFGHYYIAKLCGVHIEAFSIGFGKELFGWTDKSGTRWKFAAFPLGGYVKMFGDEGAASTPDEEKLKNLTPEEEKVAFHTQPLAAKAAIVSAGPIANFILAIIILTFFFVYYGRPETAPIVSTVQEGSPAEKIGLMPGDTIIEMDGSSITRFEDVRGIASLHPNIEITMTYVRDGQETSTSITPKLTETKDIFGNAIKIGLIGISSQEVVYTKMGFMTAAWTSVEETYNICAKTMQALGQMITGQRSAEDLSGVLRIAKYSGQSAEKGLSTVFWFMAILSINLGLINLFPIPLLDGGHLLYYAVEAASGKPLAERVQEYGYRFGLAVLVTLMVFATFNDLRHFGIL